MNYQAYIKRLETVQNMTDTTGVKELCEIVMDLIEDIKLDKPMGFTTEEQNEETSDLRRRSKKTNS